MTEFRKMPDYFERAADPDFAATQPGCFVRRDKHFCPAQDTEVLSRDGFVIVAMTIGQRGLAVHFTPNGIRQLTADLLRIADQVEAMHLDHAKAQLAATLAQKGEG